MVQGELCFNKVRVLMRYSFSFLSAFEGMDKTSFNMVLELSANSRGGLTSRYLATKLEVSEETVNYIYKLYPKLFFFDLNRIKVVPEALPIIHRVQEHLNSHGDVVSIYKATQGLTNSERRELEQKLRINRVMGWSSLASELIEKIYKTPDSVLEYVASYSFSNLAREIFDFLWQTKTGIVPINQIRQRFSDYSNAEIEDSLEELQNHFVLFELFRFNGQNRLTRFISILSEIRHHKEKIREAKEILKQPLSPANVRITRIKSCGISMAERISRLIATIAVSPVRLTSTRQISRTDEQRIYREETENAYFSSEAFIWFAEKAGWITEVDNTLQVTNLKDIAQLSLLERLKALYYAVIKSDKIDRIAVAILAELQTLKTLTWYPLNDFVKRVAARHRDILEYELRLSKNNVWEYFSSSENYNEKAATYLIEKNLFEFGVVELGSSKKQSYFRIGEIGEYLLSSSEPSKNLKEKYSRKNELVVQPNFEIIVPTIEFDPLQLIWIELFTQKKNSAGPASIYVLTKESFIKGVQNGADPNQFIQFLIQNSYNQKIPPIVITTIEDWLHTIKRVKMRHVILIEAQDSLIIADLLHRKKLAGILHPITKDQTLYVKGKLYSEIKSLLEKEGFVVD